MKFGKKEWFRGAEPQGNKTMDKGEASRLG